MSFYKCFDWFKKLRLFVNKRNLKIDIVLKTSRAVVVRWFSLNEALLGLFKFISNYLPYFEKINIFFNIITKKFELIYKDWTKLFVRFIRPLRNLLRGLHVCVQPDWGYFFMNRTRINPWMIWIFNFIPMNARGYIVVLKFKIWCDR